MNDEQIIELYFERNEAAITKSKEKYGAYCLKIAMNILNDTLDSEECLNDTWFSAWRSIPPKRPSNLAAYLGKITRNLSINCYKMKHADRRIANQFTLSLDELSECVSVGDDVESDEQAGAIGASISQFLHTQNEFDRRVFVCRYFYCDSIAEIADRFQVSESRVKSLLFRLRAKLKIHMEQEGIAV